MRHLLDSIWWKVALALWLPGLSQVAMLSRCCSSVRIPQSLDTALQSSPFAIAVLLFISWLTALSRCSFCFIFFFLSSLFLLRRSSMSAVTQGFLTRRCLLRISLVVLVTGMLKVMISVSIFVSSSTSRMKSAAQCPPVMT